MQSLATVLELPPDRQPTHRLLCVLLGVVRALAVTLPGRIVVEVIPTCMFPHSDCSPQGSARYRPTRWPWSPCSSVVARCAVTGSRRNAGRRSAAGLRVWHRCGDGSLLVGY